MSDWDAVIGEAALGLDLARVDAVRGGSGLALGRRRSRPPMRTCPAPDEERPAELAAAVGPDAIFREETLEFRTRGRATPGAVIRLGSRWITWAHRVTGLYALLAAGRPAARLGRRTGAAMGCQALGMSGGG